MEDIHIRWPVNTPPTYPHIRFWDGSGYIYQRKRYEDLSIIEIEPVIIMFADSTLIPDLLSTATNMWKLLWQIYYYCQSIILGTDIEGSDKPYYYRWEILAPNLYLTRFKQGRNNTGVIPTLSPQREYNPPSIILEKEYKRYQAVLTT